MAKKTKPRPTTKPAPKPEPPPEPSREAQRWIDARDAAQRDLNYLTDVRIIECCRRAAHTVQPDSAHTANTNPAVSGAAELTPVEAAAERRSFAGTGSKDDDTYVPRPSPDITGRWIDEARRESLDLPRRTTGIKGRVELILGIKADPPGTRVSSIVDCINPFLATHPALPRPRAGRCEPCYRYRLDHHGLDRMPNQEQTA